MNLVLKYKLVESLSHECKSCILRIKLTSQHKRAYLIDW